MAGKAVGIEIGDRNLKIIECRGKEILNTASAQILPDAIVQNGRIMAYNAMGDLIRETMKEHKIRTRTADIVLPMESYFIKRVQLPKMTAKQLKVNLPYEFHDYISGDLSHYVFDYAVLGMTEDSMDLMVCACSSELVANYVVLCKRAGLKLDKLVPDVLALQAVVLPDEDSSKPAKADRTAGKERRRRGKKNNRKAAGDAAPKRKKLSKRERIVEEELKKLGETAGAAGDAGDHATGGESAFDGAGSSYGGVPAGGAGSSAGSGLATGAGNAGRSGSAGSTGSGAGNAYQASAPAEETPQGQDYAVLDFGHTGTRLHFFSKGAYEITRTMNTSAKMVVEELAQERSIDPHIAELMLAGNHENVLKEPLVSDSYDTMATEIQRVMNFYSYSNPKNTIETIYYFGDGLNADEMAERIEEAIGLPVRPLTDLIPEAEGKPDVLLSPQAYGCVLE